MRKQTNLNFTITPAMSEKLLKYKKLKEDRSNVKNSCKLKSIEERMDKYREEFIKEFRSINRVPIEEYIKIKKYE